VKRLLFAACLLAAAPLRADWEGSDARPAFLRPGGIILFMNSRAPLSFKTLTPGEVPADASDAGPVSCRSCQHGVAIPVTQPTASSRGASVSGAGGDGGFEKALARLKKERPELRGIYDVKVDLRRVSVLGIYRRQCLEVSARGFK